MSRLLPEEQVDIFEDEDSDYDSKPSKGYSTSVVVLRVCGTVAAAIGFALLLYIINGAFFRFDLFPWSGFFTILGAVLLVASLISEFDWDCCDITLLVLVGMLVVSYLMLLLTYSSTWQVPPFWWVFACILMWIGGVFLPFWNFFHCGCGPCAKDIHDDSEGSELDEETQGSCGKKFINSLGFVLCPGVCCVSSSILTVGVLLAGIMATGSYSSAFCTQDMFDSVLAAQYWDEFANISVTTNNTRPENCTITGEGVGACRLSTLPVGAPYLIHPGGSTACLDDESDYFFRVVRGDPTKLLFFMQGGGACWNYVTFRCGLCSENAYMVPLTGILDVQNKSNPFYNYTLVQVMYCSGDLHTGDADQFWISPTRRTSAWKQQRGIANTRSVLEYIKAQFVGPDAALQNLTSFLFAGSSAGALGVNWWSQTVFSELQGRYDPLGAYAVADSFIDVMPNHKDELVTPVLNLFGACNTGHVLTVGGQPLVDKCNAGLLHFSSLYEIAIVDFPLISFSHVNSKFDVVQVSFANALSSLSSIFSTLRSKAATFTPAEYYEEVSERLGAFSQYPNYEAYLVDSDQHTYLQEPDLAATDPAGPNDYCYTADAGMTLQDWISPTRHMSSNSRAVPGHTIWQCYDLSSSNATPWSGTYCDSKLPWNASKQCRL